MNNEQQQLLNQLLTDAKDRIVAAQALLTQYPPVLKEEASTSPTSPQASEASPSPLQPIPSPPPMAWGKKLSLTARNFIATMSNDFSVPADWFTSIMAFETLETFDPAIRPRRKDGTLVSSAVGLIQFLEATAEGLGTTTDALSKMSVEEQLKYVWLYFRDGFRNAGRVADSIEDLYMLVNWPAAFGKPMDTAMYVAGTAAYAANGGLDLNHDSVITKAEAGALVKAKLAKGLQPEYYG